MTHSLCSKLLLLSIFPVQRATLNLLTCLYRTFNGLFACFSLSTSTRGSSSPPQCCSSTRLIYGPVEPSGREASLVGANRVSVFQHSLVFQLHLTHPASSDVLFLSFLSVVQVTPSSSCGRRPPSPPPTHQRRSHWETCQKKKSDTQDETWSREAERLLRGFLS